MESPEEEKTMEDADRRLVGREGRKTKEASKSKIPDKLLLLDWIDCEWFRLLVSSCSIVSAFLYILRRQNQLLKHSPNVHFEVCVRDRRTRDAR